MTCAKYTGPRGLVEIGSKRLEPGDIVGEPGSGAPVEGCLGVVEYLLQRGDFHPVDGDGEAVEENTGPTSILPPPPVQISDDPFSGIEVNGHGHDDDEEE